jgi:hypothetical protein
MEVWKSETEAYSAPTSAIDGGGYLSIASLIIGSVAVKNVR